MMTKKNIWFRLTHHAVLMGLFVLAIAVILCMPQMNKASHAQGSPSNIGMYNANAMASVAEEEIRTSERNRTADRKEIITAADIHVDEDEKSYEETDNTEE